MRLCITMVSYEEPEMAISDLDRHSFPASSATPVLPWWAQPFALPGRLACDTGERHNRQVARDQLAHLTDHQLNDLGLERGPYKAGRHDDPEVRWAERWLSTPPR